MTDTANDPRSLTDAEITMLVEHYQSREYALASGGGWMPLAALLELQRRRRADAVARAVGSATDLTADEVANWATGRPTNPTTDQGVRMATEIQRHRAALAADRERVRSVVYEEAMRKMCLRIDLSDTHEIDATHIAIRASERLATAAPVFDAADRDVMLRMRKSIQWSGEFTALLDRLLTGRVTAAPHRRKRLVSESCAGCGAAPGGLCPGVTECEIESVAFQPGDDAILRGLWLDCAIGAATADAQEPESAHTVTAYKKRMEVLDRLHVLATGRHCQREPIP